MPDLSLERSPVGHVLSDLDDERFTTSLVGDRHELELPRASIRVVDHAAPRVRGRTLYELASLDALRETIGQHHTTVGIEHDDVLAE